MHRGKILRYSVLVFIYALGIAGAGQAALATTLESPNYKVVETEFGSGSSDEVCSGSFCSRTAIGTLVIGDSAAGSRRVEFGPITEDEPALEVIVEPGSTDVGQLTTTTTATKTAVVKVRNYLSNGYTMQVVGSAPSIAGHTLATPATPTASTQGTEQFGINFVANTTPSIGSDPVQIPSSEFSFGTVDSEYNTTNLFKYQNGDLVASSSTESGQTEYTMSLIVNVAGTTPAGKYVGNYSIVVVPVF